jgi:hypothetical protein
MYTVPPSLLKVGLLLIPHSHQQDLYLPDVSPILVCHSTFPVAATSPYTRPFWLAAMTSTVPSTTTEIGELWKPAAVSSVQNSHLRSLSPSPATVASSNA